MSYVHRRSRTFHKEEKTLYRIRSEGRMKSYDSSTDFRAWSDIVEDGDNSKSNLERNFGELSFLDEDITGCKEQTDEGRDEIIKIFEGDWVDMKTERTIYNSTPSSLVNVEVSCTDISVEVAYPGVSCEALVENVTHKAIIEGVVILSNPLSPKIIPEGYFAGTDVPVSTELLFVHEEKISDIVIVFSKSDLCINDKNESIRENTYDFDQPLLLSSREESQPLPVIPDNSGIPDITDISDIPHTPISPIFLIFLTFLIDSVITYTEEQLGIISKEHLAQTEKQINTDLKDQGCQTEQLMEFTSYLKRVLAQNYIQQRTHSYRRSRSTICLNRGQFELPRTVKSQLDLVTIRKHLKSLEFPVIKQKIGVKIFEEKRCGTDDCIDVYRLFKDTLDNINIKVTRSWSNDIDDDLSFILIHKNAEIIALKDALEAKESYCIEQTRSASAALEKLESIKNVAEECDELKKKLERSQEELNQLKKEKLMKLGIQHEDSACGTERETDSLSTCSLSTCSLTPKVKAKIITREMQFKKKLSDQLAAAHEENFQLKEKLYKFEELFNELGIDNLDTAYIDLKYKFKCLEETIQERDHFRNKMEALSTRLRCYNYTIEDVEVFKQRSLLLDEVLQDRDRLSKRVEQLRGLDEEVIKFRAKSLRVEQLEDDLRKTVKEKKMAEDEVDVLRGRCSIAEIEVINQKAEGDALRSKLVCREHEMENLKSASKERERLIAERDHLKHNLDELVRMQDDFEHMKKQMKCLDILKAERDIFKSKYETLIGLESECDILRTQVDKAKVIEKERDSFESQVYDLQACITEQEAEIKRLVSHIDLLAETRDEQQEKLKEVITNLRAELEQKECLIVSAEKKLSTLQNELCDSIQGLSSETVDIKTQNDKLEKQVQKSEQELKVLNDHIATLLKDNENLTKQVNDLIKENNYLVTNVKEKENSLVTLKEVLKDHESILDEFQKVNFQPTAAQRDMETETDEPALITITAANVHSIAFHEKLTRMGKIAGNANFQKLLMQSKEAIQKIARELEKQYKDWDNFKSKLKYQKNCNSCNKGTYTVGCSFTNESIVNSGNRKRRCIRATRKAKLAEKRQHTTLIEKQDHSTGSNIPFKFTSRVGQPEVKVDTQLLTASKTMQTTEDAFTSIESESLLLVFESIQNEQKDEEGEAFESARSVDCERCKILAERLQILEKELSTANETFVQLQDKLDRATAENSALRQHSTEVQEVAKGQIKDLVEHLKDYKEKCSSLENESNKLQKRIKELRNQKDELENLLASNIVANSCKNSIIEGDLDYLENENKGLKEEINRLEKLEEENMRLREILTKAQKESADPKLVKSLQLENEKMTEKIDTQYEEISMLVEKIKTSPLPPELPVDRDKDALRSISDALENQLNKLEKMPEIIKPPKVNFKNVIEDLTIRLTDAEKRAEMTQFTLSNLKINDPVAMLNAEITKLIQTICIIEDKNSKLNEAILQKIDEIQSQKEKIETIQRDNVELQKENTELKEDHIVDKLKSEGELQNNANEYKKASTTISALLNDSDTLKQELLRIQNECEKLKKELKEAKKHDQRETEENVIYQIQTQDLINALDKFRIISAKLKNELGNSIACDANERLNQAIKENNMLKEANRESDDELSKLKISFSLRDKQVQVLEETLMRHETENNKLKTDLEISNKEIAQLLENLAILQKENEHNKGGNDNINDLNDENSKFTEEINRITDNLTEANNKISLLKSENKNLNNNLNETLEDKKIINEELLKLKYHETVLNQRLEHLVQLESENVKLKKDISTIFEKFNRKIITLQSEMGNLRMENEKLKNNVESAKNEIEIWIQKSSQLEESNKKLLEEYKHLSQIQNDNMNLKKSINEMENENEKLRRQYEEARGDFKKTLSESDNYKANEEKLINEIEQVEEENKKLKNIINCVRERNEILEKELESEKTRVKREIKSDEIEKLIQMETECKTLKTDLNNALNEVKKSAESQNANKQEIAMLKIEKEELKNNNLVEKLEEQNSVMKDTNNQLEHEVEKLRSELFDSLRQKEKICELEKKLVSLKNDLDAALKEIKSSNEVALQLRSHNSKQKQQIYDLEYEIDKLTSTVIEFNQNNKTKTENEIENKSFKDKIHELENVAEKLKNEVNILKDERNQLLVDLNKAKENEIHIKNLIADLESTNFKLKQGLEPEIVEDSSALSDMLKQMEIEHKNLKIKLKNTLEDVKNKSIDINKLKEDSMILKERIADLEKTNIKLKDCNVKIDSHKSEKEMKILLQKYMDEIAKLKEAHAELIRVLNKKHENETKILKDAFNDVEKKLLEANNERDKLKNLLVEQKRKSKDIKCKVDQVEGLINSERRKYKEEQIKNKALDEKIHDLNEKIDFLDKQLEFKNKEIIEMNTKLQKQMMEKESTYDENGEKIYITTISEKEMIFFGKPSCACKPNFNYAMKKLAEEGLESLNPDELQVLNNTLAETTADRLAQVGESFGVLKPDENNKLALLKKIAILEEDLVKKQKHAHQKVTAMKFAVKLEKHRLHESKQKLDEERLKNQKLLSEMGLQSQSISSRKSDHKDLTSKPQQDSQMNQQVSKKISQTKLSADPIKHNKKRASSKAQEKSKPQTSMASEMTLKIKSNEQKSQKRHSRRRSLSRTPVKDTNGPSPYGSDKGLETMFTSSSTCDRLD